MAHDETLNMEIETSVVIPCLNEAETLGECFKKAFLGLGQVNSVGEVLVADNGSTDGSIEIAEGIDTIVRPGTPIPEEKFDGRRIPHESAWFDF